MADAPRPEAPLPEVSESRLAAADAVEDVLEDAEP